MTSDHADYVISKKIHEDLKHLVGYKWSDGNEEKSLFANIKMLGDNCFCFDLQLRSKLLHPPSSGHFHGRVFRV